MTGLEVAIPAILGGAATAAAGTAASNAVQGAFDRTAQAEAEKKSSDAQRKANLAKLLSTAGQDTTKPASQIGSNMQPSYETYGMPDTIKALIAGGTGFKPYM